MKEKFKNKGFTLLELLAVIIVLGIIALIAISTVGNIVEYSKKEAFKTSVKTIIKTGENYSSVAQLNSGNKLSYPVSFNCDGKACTNGDTKLEFTGKVPVSGSIVVEDAKTVKASYISDGKYCVSGTKDDLSIGEKCGDIDTTKPTITGTLTRDLLKLTMHDGESGIDSYCVSSTVGTSTCKWNEVKGNYAEHTLTKNGTYTAYAKDKKGNVSEGITFITDDIEAPQLIGTLDKDVLKLVITDDGDGVDSYCITTTNDSNTCQWIATEKSYVEYTFTKSNVYYAFAKDKSDNISNSLKIDTGDIEAPTTPTIGLIGDVTGSDSNSTILVPASGSIDDRSVVTYKYIISNDKTVPSKSDSRFSINRNFTRSCGTSYYAWAIAEDETGNRSSVFSLGSTSDGENKYSEWSECSVKCGGGKRTRTNSCALITEELEEECNTQSCQVETIWDKSGVCASDSCTNNTASKSWSGTVYYNNDKGDWNRLTGSANGPSFTMDLTDVKMINYVYKISATGSYDSTGYIRLTVKCGAKSAAVAASRDGGDNNASRSGTLSLDVSSLTGETTCTSSVSYNGAGLNKNYGYNVGGSYSITRIYPTYN